MQRPLFLILSILFSFSIQAQRSVNISIPTIEKACEGGSLEVDFSSSGVFDPGNKFVLNYYNSSNTVSSNLLKRDTLTVVNGKIALMPDIGMAGKSVYLSVFSTSPYQIFNQGFLPVYGVTKAYRYLNLESKVYDPKEQVELVFGRNFDLPTWYFFNDGDSLLTSNLPRKSILLDSTGNYGISRTRNVCGVNDTPVFYHLKVKPQRLTFYYDSRTYCQGETVKILLQSDMPLDNLGPLDLSFEFDNATYPYTVNHRRNGDYLEIDIPQNYDGNMLDTYISWSNGNVLEKLTFQVKRRAHHILSGTYFSFSGSSFEISDYQVSNIPEGFNHSQTQIALSNGMVLTPDESGRLYASGLEPGFYSGRGIYNDCPQSYVVGFSVFEKSEIKVTGLPEEICINAGLEIPVEGNVTINTGSVFSVVFEDQYRSKRITLQGIGINSGAIRVEPSQLELITDLRVPYYVSIEIPGQNYTGTESENMIRLLKPPSIHFTGLEPGNPYWNTGTVAAYFDAQSFVDGFVTMSDGKDYPLIRSNNGNGRIVLMPTQPGSYYPLMTFNSCGTNANPTGSFNLIWNNASTPAILLGWINSVWYCSGDSLDIDWQAYGTFEAGNTFFAEFLSTNGQITYSSVEISPGENKVKLPTLSQDGFRLFRIRSSSTNYSSTMRTLMIHGTEVPSPLTFTGEVVSHAIQGGHNSGTQIDATQSSEVKFNLSPGQPYVALDTQGNLMSFSRSYSFEKDTLFLLKAIRNGCYTYEVNKSVDIHIEKPKILIKELSRYCTPLKSQLYISYLQVASTVQKSDLNVFLRKGNSGQLSMIDYNILNSELLLIELTNEDFDPGNYVLELHSSTGVLIKSFNFEIYPSSYRLTSSLGNYYESFSIPVYSDLLFDHYGLQTYQLNTLNGYPPEVSTDQKIYAFYGQNECGYYAVKDTIEINIIPHITYINGMESPCIGSSDSIVIFYTGTQEDFETNAGLKIYLKQGESKFYLENGIRVKGRFTAPIPNGLVSGVYLVGYERQNPYYDYLFTNRSFPFQKSQDVRVISGTLYKYPGEPYVYPVYANGDNDSVNVVTNISDIYELMDEYGMPTFEYSWVKIAAKDYTMVSQSTLFDQESYITPSGFSGLTYNSCGGNLSGSMNVVLLDENGPKIRSILPSGKPAILINCQIGDTLEVVCQFEGLFNPENQFIPQISDGFGINFSDLIFWPHPTLINHYFVKLPEYLLPAEGYRIRFRSTSPTIFGASSTFGVVVKSPPSLQLVFDSPIVEGDSVEIGATLQGNVPFSLEIPGITQVDELFTSNYSFYTAPVRTVTFSPKLKDNYCDATLTNIYNIQVNCRQLVDLEQRITTDITERAEVLNIVSRINEGVKADFQAGKYLSLEPGFIAPSGSSFQASIGGCP